MRSIELDSDLLNFIVDQEYRPGDRLPTIAELGAADKLNISVSKVREQLEVARALGLVDVKSQAGTRLKDYSFTPAVHLSLFFALATDPRYFEQFSALRTHVEVAFWQEACEQLTAADKDELRGYIEAAWAKLNAPRIRIPNEEHRAFHLTIFRHLDNVFVKGLLEAYWDAYAAVEVSVYADLSYHREVWAYHQRILDAICAGDFDAAQEAYIQHTHLLHYQPRLPELDAVTASLAEKLPDTA